MLMLTFYQNVPLITTENILSSGESVARKPLPGLKSGQTIIYHGMMPSAVDLFHSQQLLEI